jgi:membrane peptidoglycan carboxypeptidase
LEATDAKTAATMREMMEAVMLEGTGKKSQLDGYTSAGKSGTAQKIDTDTGRYSATQYVASFVGFAPVNDPAVTILVVLDSPVGPHHGGEVGAPVFKRIAEQVLAYLDVPHDVASPTDTESASNLHPKHKAPASSPAAREDETQFKEAVARETQKQAAVTVAFGSPDAVDVPDFAGRAVREVTETCSHLGLAPALIGSGIALDQYPKSGVTVVRGSRVTVWFGRPGEKPVRGDGN